MRRCCHSIVWLVCVFLFGACNRQNIYDEKAKTLDSLSGALNAAIKELRAPDTVSLQKASKIFEHYKKFIRLNVSDTIKKADADVLKHFYASGTNLTGFSGNRYSILERARLVNMQLVQLTADARNRSLESEQLVKFVEAEKAEANALIERSSQQKRMFYSAMEEFKSTLAGVEQLIKSRNNGELPTIVTDETPL